ncbi:MAG TPA: SGNH/GDSL hydrolase family protein [Terracidiphilus sp.]|nr:SGNH/GDSL hydrolase family protein [Terracidiphilus sp.]
MASLLLMADVSFAAGRDSNEVQAEQSPWVATWGASMMSTGEGAPDVSGQTLRLIIHTTLGGPKVRIWLSNQFGAVPLRIDAAHIAVCAYTDPLAATDGSAVRSETDRALKFNVRESVTIPPGATIVSDPVALDVPPLSDLAISLYFPEHTRLSTVHSVTQQLSFAALGNATGASTLSGSSWSERTWYVLSGVDVYAPGNSAVVALGDSITDGNHSTPNANRRWPDVLAARLQADPKARQAGVLAVVDSGISGNRVLLDGTGPNALSRFERDVLSRSGVRYLILFEGINDIEAVTRQHQPYTDLNAQLEWALSQMVHLAHERGIRVYGATQMPDCRNPHCASAEGEATRNTLNEWIRASRLFDGVIDFDRITRDPDHPSQLLPRYDSGDSVHPNDEGYAAMANGIDLGLFTTPHSRSDNLQPSHQ